MLSIPTHLAIPSHFHCLMKAEAWPIAFSTSCFQRTLALGLGQLSAVVLTMQIAAQVIEHSQDITPIRIVNVCRDIVERYLALSDLIWLTFGQKLYWTPSSGKFV